MKQGKKRGRLVIPLLLCLAVGSIAVVIIYSLLVPQVVDVVTMEAGSELVDVKEFLKGKNSKGFYVDEISSQILQTPGIYEVQIKVKNRVHTSSLNIVDSIAPTAKTIDQIIIKGETVDADAFVNDITDATDVTVTYKNIPDFSKLGDQSVELLLKDTSGNVTTLSAILTIFDIRKVEVEAGTVPELRLEDFMDVGKYSAKLVTNLDVLDFSLPTTYDIAIDVDGRTVPTVLEVVDTTPPTATVVDQEIWLNDVISAEEFVTDIIDVSQVTVSFKSNPDTTVLGNQEVTLTLEDSYGNSSEMTAKLSIIADTQAPRINGVTNKEVFIGDSISFRKGVTVTDNRDAEVTLTIESSKVNLKKEGTYELVYSAIDSSGNKAEKISLVTVKEFHIEEDAVYKMADGILKKITTDEMSLREKAWEIFEWVKGHVSYTGSSDKSSWLKEAYRGMKNGVGDCFTYYAVSQALLTRAGIDNMRVTRVGGRTRHYWNLINCGDGWYHFDTCPTKDKHITFMLTDKEVEKYTKQRGNNYYNFDKSLYPATPDK